MKLVYFNDFRFGVMKDDRVIDATDIVSGIPHRTPQDLIAGVIERFDEFRPALQALVELADGVPVETVRLRPPLPRPGNIVCMAVNYMEDGTLPEAPAINAFHKANGTVIGNGDTMVLPDVAGEIFEGEAELALIIGKRAKQVNRQDALSHIFGYTCFIDGSARGLPPANNVFFQMKSRDTFTAIGPCIVTADEIADPQNLQIRLVNNGQVMQDFNTDDMAHKIPRCIEWLSSIHTLEPGDLVATGTNHRGLNPFMNGDIVQLDVEKVGTLSIKIQDDLKRTWRRVTRDQHKVSGAAGNYTRQISGKYAANDPA